MDLVDDDLAPSTVTRCHAALKKALADAVAVGRITASPAAGVKPPRVDQIERRFLTLDELNRIETAVAPRWQVVVPPPRCPRAGGRPAPVVCDSGRPATAIRFLLIRRRLLPQGHLGLVAGFRLSEFGLTETGNDDRPIPAIGAMHARPGRSP